MCIFKHFILFLFFFKWKIANFPQFYLLTNSFLFNIHITVLHLQMPISLFLPLLVRKFAGLLFVYKTKPSRMVFQLNMVFCEMVNGKWNMKNLANTFYFIFLSSFFFYFYRWFSFMLWNVIPWLEIRLYQKNDFVSSNISISIGKSWMD